MGADDRTRFIIGYRDATTGQPCPPNPKQALAHASEADELLYGGAAFGGKSEFAIWEAIALCLMYPGGDVAIFRRTHTELEHDLIHRFLKYVPAHLAKYNDSKKIATFFNGSRLLFCYCHTAKDRYRYKSDQWIGLIIDQAEGFTEEIALYLCSRVRTARPGIRPRIRLTANPGEIGHGWLKARYIAPTPEVLGHRPLPAYDGEVWRPRPNPTLANDQPITRAFIQARMGDNQPGMRADPAYVQRIRANPNEAMRRMLEDGDWDAFEGQMFAGWRPSRLVAATDDQLLDAGLTPGQVIPWHVVPDSSWRPPAGSLVYGSVDYGYGNPWAAHFHAAMPDGHLVTFKEFYATQVRDREQAARIKDWLLEEWAIQDRAARPRWRIPYIVGDIPFGSRMEHGLATSVHEVYEDVLGIPLDLNIQLAAKGPGSRKSRVQRTLDALAPAPDGFPHAQITAACPNLIRTLPQLIVDPTDPDDILHGVGRDKQEDHAYDSLSTFYVSRPAWPRPAVAPDGRDGYRPLLSLAAGGRAPR